MAFVPCRIEPSSWSSFELLQVTLDAIPDPIFVKDLEHRWVACNEGFCALIGRSRDELIGHSDPDYWPPEQASVFWRFDDEVFRTGQPNENEEQATGADGVARTLWTRKFPLRNAEGDVIGLCGVITDVTQVNERQRKAERLELDAQRALLTAQEEMLDRIAMPVVTIWHGILLVPLVGELSERRAARATEALLGAIDRESAEFVILDVTGVPVVNGTVAQRLVQTAQAAGLLGCRSILVGVGPEMAMTLVKLDAPLGQLTTRGTLQSGLEYAMTQLSRRGKRGAPSPRGTP
jgi:rsbT co-antagonist protein RsbR